MADRSTIRSRGNGEEKKKTPSSARTLPPSAILDSDDKTAANGGPMTPNGTNGSSSAHGGSSRRDGDDDDEEEPTADGMTAEEEAEAEKVLAEIEAAKKKAAKVAGDAPATVEISQGTVEEVERMHVKNTRQLLGYFITQPRIRFGKQVTFDDNDPEKIGEYRRTRVESYGLTRDTLDMGFQAAAEMKDANTQTEWRNKVNKVMQYESQTYTNEDEERIFNSELLLNFLDQAEMRCRQALQGNEAIDLFKDEFAQFEEEEQNSSSRLDNSLKELHAFHELALSRHKSVSGINWHPTRQGVVAFSCANNLTFEQWVDVSGKVLSSWVFIWHFSDPLHPQLLLEVPGDLQCFKINPHNANYIIGGLATGQVIFWDLSEARAKMAMARDFGTRHSTTGAPGAGGGAAGGTAAGSHDKDNKGSMSHRGLSTAAGGGDRKDEKASGSSSSSESSITPIKPSFISYIDRSHSRPVTDIEWMQPQREMTRKGEMVDVKDGVKYSSQFMTVAGDGYLIVWDVRQQVNRSQARAPPPPGVVVNNNNVAHDENGGISLAPLPVAPINKEEARWVPLYTIPLNKEGGGTISAIKFATVDELGTKLMCVTEDGELAWVDWQPSKPSAISLSDRMSSAMMMSMSSSNDDKKTETVQRLAPVHLQACTSIQRSPHFPDMFLTSGDWTFTIWKLDFETPVFVSPYAHDYITAARWSPTRPGVIVAALANGQIDVWDFLDQCHKPTLTHPTGSESLTSIEFFQSKNSSQQLLAAGDALGKLHILEMPRNLRKKVGGESSSASAAAAAAANAAGAHGAYYRKNPQAARLAFAGLTEEQTMKNFYDREISRVKYAGKRQVIRAAEKKQDDDARELASKRSQASASHTFEDRPHYGDTKEPALSADAEAKAAIEEEKLETAYQKMLRDFKTMLVDQPAAAAAAAAEKARIAAEEAAKAAAAAAAAMTIVGAAPPTPGANGTAAAGTAPATANGARGLSVPLAGVNGTAAGTRGGAAGATSTRLGTTGGATGVTATTARGTARLAAGSGVGATNAAAPPLVARQRVSAGAGN